MCEYVEGWVGDEEHGLYGIVQIFLLLRSVIYSRTALRFLITFMYHFPPKPAEGDVAWKKTQFTDEHCAGKYKTSQFILLSSLRL